MDVVVYWNCAGGVACCPTVWLAVLDADALAMSWSNCISTGWLRCVSRASRISLKKRSGFSTRRCASFSGRSSAIAIRISSHSFGIRSCSVIWWFVFCFHARSRNSEASSATLLELSGQGFLSCFVFGWFLFLVFLCGFCFVCCLLLFYFGPDLTLDCVIVLTPLSTPQCGT